MATLLETQDMLSQAQAEIARLRAELTKVASVVDNDVRLMDPPDGGDPTTAEKVANLRALYEAAEARALAAEARMGEVVKVRPLEWRRGRGWPASAETPFGSYKIWAGKDVWFRDEMLNGKHAKSEDEAQQWAQADYEARIRSALAKENDHG